MSSSGGQFLLLLWKNFVLQKRKKCVTVFEIIVPLFFAVLLLLIRSISDSKYVDTDTTWDAFYLKTPVVIPSERTKIYFAPNNTHTYDLMQDVANDINGTLITAEPFDDEASLLASYTQNDSKDVWAAVIFNSNTSTSLPDALDYTLRVALRKDDEDSGRWRTENTYPFFETFSPRDDTTTGGEPYYYETGFLTLQYFINKNIINTHSGAAGVGTTTSLKVDVTMKKMLFPEHLDDVLTSVLQQNLPFFLVLSFLLNALQIAKNISYEKEKKLKEAMKMMGLSTTMYWLSWFVKCLIYLVIVIFLYTVIFAIPVGDKGKVLNYTHPTVFFVFLLCYVVSIIAFSFMISTFFNKAFTAAFFAGILFFLTYFPVFFLADRYQEMSVGEKIGACLLSNVAMAFGTYTIVIHEGTGEGAQWSNLAEPGSIDDNFTLLMAMIMLLADTVLYMLIAWYVDKINPGDAGLAQPPWFPFMPSFWCGTGIQKDNVLEDGEQNGDVSTQYFARDPPGATVGIKIKHLRKVFNGKVAVRDTTLNMFEGQITSLLGHNGAGKTTTISMLTGFLEPTSGSAIVNGYSIRTDIDKVRKNLGLCPQHNILFDTMTVAEHLEFFARLKGCSRADVKKEVNDMIKVLGLQQKTHALSMFLSGGQKRKLSVGIALIAGSKVVILDEPTSGMDPAARRQTWEILQRYREGRTIILTTHFMDEADVLGDRIAIMADGVVKCCGPSMFLKKLYGAGYHLTMVKNNNCNVQRLTDVVTSHISTAVKEREISAEISYLLPFDESAKYEGLFQEIEKRMTELGISSFGASATTMEEVFLKVAEADEEEEMKISGVRNGKQPALAFVSEKNGSGFQNPTSHISANKLPPITANGGISNGAYINESQHNTVVNVDKQFEKVGNTSFIEYNANITKNTGLTLAGQQFYSMFVKKVLQAVRNKATAATQILLPIIFTILALTVEQALPDVGDEPALQLNLGKFKSPVTAYSGGATVSSDGSYFAGNYSTVPQNGGVESVDRTTYTTMDAFFKAKQGEIGTGSFNKKYIVAGDFEYNTSASYTLATAHYNGQPYHSTAISLQFTMAGILKKLMGSTYDLTVTNHPLPKNINDNFRRLFYSTNGTGFTIAVSILFGTAFMSASFIIFLIKERSVGAKHLQAVSGVGPIAFWFSTFVWDFINIVIPSLAILVVFAAFQTDAYTNNGRLGLVFLLFLLYGWSVLPFIYMLHYLFKVPASGMVAVSFLNILTGIVFILASYTLSIPALNTEDIGKALEWVFIIFFPNYNLGLGLMDMYTNAGYNDICEEYNYKTLCLYLENPCCFPDRCGNKGCFTFYENFLAWEKPGIGRECFFMCLQGIVYFTIVLLAEAGILRSIMNLFASSGNGVSVSMGSGLMGEPEDDSDVANEKTRINNTPVEDLQDTDSLILKNVSKIYGNGYHAVKGVNIGIPSNECFGLLGQNGAGKTTTFKMMTGDEPISSGSAYLNRFSVKGNIKQVQQNLGYCPQFDGLIDQMTGRETLTMYARLRGIQENQIARVIDNLIDVLMLREHAEKQTGFYSGGNKRKLSTAIALIGDPPFIFLDEPTTGMDPHARRQLWNVLSEVRASGRTLVLTSHSMEECEALCTRIVIMVNGKFMCYGSTQHLIGKFGHGYTLFCRMALDQNGYIVPTDPLKSFIQETFRNTKVFDSDEGYIDFQIPDDSAKLAQIFGVMEKAKAQYAVEDYSVHQTTLEQIFLTFTKNQIAPAEEKKKACAGLCCCT